jgi:hypothetical protein
LELSDHVESPNLACGREIVQETALLMHLDDEPVHVLAILERNQPTFTTEFLKVRSRNTARELKYLAAVGVESGRLDVQPQQ